MGFSLISTVVLNWTRLYFPARVAISTGFFQVNNSKDDEIKLINISLPSDITISLLITVNKCSVSDNIKMILHYFMFLILIKVHLCTEDDILIKMFTVKDLTIASTK